MPTWSSRRRTCITPRPGCCRRSSAPTRSSGGTSGPRALERSSCSWASKASCRSSLTTRCCSHATGARTSSASSGVRAASRIPLRSMCASRARPTRASRRPATRTSSCSSLCPPIRSLGHGGEDGDGDPRIETAADAVIAQLSEWCGIPDLAERIVVRRTIAPGDFEADLHAWRGNALGLAHTLNQSAASARGTSRSAWTGSCTPEPPTLPGIGLPMCLISAELVVKRLRGDRSPGPLPEPAAAKV